MLSYLEHRPYRAPTAFPNRTQGEREGCEALKRHINTETQVARAWTNQSLGVDELIRSSEAQTVL